MHYIRNIDAYKIKISSYHDAGTGKQRDPTKQISTTKNDKPATQTMPLLLNCHHCSKDVVATKKQRSSHPEIIINRRLSDGRPYS
jgi:hypothetical protein